MTTILIAAVAALLVIAAAVVVFIRRRAPKPLNTDQFQEKWREMQKKLKDKDSWKAAVTEADTILDEALKKKRFNGKNMGERLTKAQRLISDNESVWFGHKLRKQIESEPDMKVKEKDVKQALIGIRQALKDLGAFPDGSK